MASRWESSTRPLTVRTVWVNGLRHAILTREELLPPAARGGGGGSSPGTSRPPSAVSLGHHGELARCLVRWKLVVGRGSPSHREDHGVEEEDDEEDDGGAEADAEEEGDEPDANSHHEQQKQQMQHPALIGSYCRTFQPLSCTPDASVEQPSSSSSSSSSPPPPPPPPPMPPPGERQLNPLSERVLQWLDLAGRGGPQPPRARCSSSSTQRVGRPPPVPRTARKSYPVAASDLPAAAIPSPSSPEAGRRCEAPAPPPPPPPPPPPLIQTFQHMTLSRNWSAPTAQSRPQLHIFVPAIQDKCQSHPLDLSDCESGISDT